MIAKCGDILTWHWAHMSIEDCDPWAEPNNEWHRGWQMLVPPDRREVRIGKHRADMLTRSGRVIELQDSYLPPTEIRVREHHYGNMLWIFNAIEPYANDRLLIRPRDGYVSFRWKQPRKSLAWCQRPVLLDIGYGQLLHVKKIHTEAPCGGWGRIITLDGAL